MMRDLVPREWKAPELPERYLFDLRSECNLACPMCLLHGAPDSPEKEAMIGKMSVERARQLLDEIMTVKPLIQPSMWGEPLLAKDLKVHLKQMKDRGIAVAFNTNGLTLREDLARFLVGIKLDSVFFSVDATTPETLKKVRGIDRLDKIKNNIAMLLRVRGEMGSVYPRIGVSMTVQKDNEHEQDAFVKYWVGIVDVVRLGRVYADGKLDGVDVPKKRVPCKMIYETMAIHYNGDVSICCLDSHAKMIMGNVFHDGGVKAVWNGEKFRWARRLHETGQYDEIPFCKNCNAWSGHLYVEETDEIGGQKVLIRRSYEYTYYNRIDRLASWHEHIRGHAKLDTESVRALEAAP
jgi:radical SAM protein with 4Fe4S-binding SPASM domain